MSRGDVRMDARGCALSARLWTLPPRVFAGSGKRSGTPKIFAQSSERRRINIRSGVVSAATEAMGTRSMVAVEHIPVPALDSDSESADMMEELCSAEYCAFAVHSRISSTRRRSLVAPRRFSLSNWKKTSAAPDELGSAAATIILQRQCAGV